MQLLDKLLELKNKWTAGRADDDVLVVVDSWIERAKYLLLLNSLKDHDGIKYVLEIFQSEIDKINNQLLNQRDMGQDERYRLLDQRALAQKYLDLFNPIDSELEEIENKVDENY